MKLENKLADLMENMKAASLDMLTDGMKVAERELSLERVLAI